VKKSGKVFTYAVDCSMKMPTGGTMSSRSSSVLTVESDSSREEKKTRVRACPGIICAIWPPIHPGGLRFSSVEYSRYSPSSCLAGRATHRPYLHTLFLDGPFLFSGMIHQTVST